MLGEDYPRVLGSLMSTLAQRIELPLGQEGFFQESGSQPSYDHDQRCSERKRIRTHGVLMLDNWYPALDRQPHLMAIYTTDFSKTGFGLIAAEQFYPGEIVQVFLATFWMRVTIRRCRRLGPQCYNCGGTLLNRHDPDDEAMDLLAAAQLQAH